MTPANSGGRTTPSAAATHTELRLDRDDAAVRGITFRQLGSEDAGEVLTVQRAAFVAEARLYGTVEIPPLVETLDEMRRELETTVTIGVTRGHRLVGAVRLTVDDPIGWISRIAVAPDQQGMGIGSGLVGAVEDAAPPDVRRFQLAAGAKSGSNISLYERLGYQAFASDVDTAGVEMTLMFKERRKGA